MSLTDLFPGPGYYLVSWYANSNDEPVIMRERAHMCARCGSLVPDKQRHYRWHQAGATTALPSDSAPRSSGAGRPNPKDPK